MAKGAGARTVQGYALPLLLLPGWVAAGRFGVELVVALAAAWAATMTALIVRDTVADGRLRGWVWAMTAFFAPLVLLATSIYPNSLGAAAIATTYRLGFTAPVRRPLPGRVRYRPFPRRQDPGVPGRRLHPPDLGRAGGQGSAELPGARPVIGLTPTVSGQGLTTTDASARQMWAYLQWRRFRTVHLFPALMHVCQCEALDWDSDRFLDTALRSLEHNPHPGFCELLVDKFS